MTATETTVTAADLPLTLWPAVRALGPDAPIRTPDSGTMNDTWLVGDTGSGPTGALVMRRHRFTDLDRVTTEHRVMTHARNAGIPVPAVLPTDDGSMIADHGGRWWTVYAFAVGDQVRRQDLEPDLARAMGATLGHLHTALARLEPAAEPMTGAGDQPTADVLLAEIAELRSMIGTRRDRQPEDDWADAELGGHADWVARNGLAEPEPVPADEIQVLHGDYQESNLFFTGQGSATVVSGIIDWDKAEVGPRGFEVVRCLKLSFRFDLSLSRAFLAGYRSTGQLSTAQLQRSVRNEHARALTGLWLPQMIYRHGEDRLRKFLRPGGFRTVLDRWPDGLT